MPDASSPILDLADSKIKSWATEIESEARTQLENLANLPFIFSHIAVMPDVHAGKGSTIGSVLATRGAIIPAAVGVDIGCGMSAVKLPFKIDIFGDSLKELRHSIERSIPVGFQQNRNVTERMETRFQAILTATSLNRDLRYKALHQLGTLGGGNHFIELCYDQNQQAWVMLHSGSRHLGKSLADRHINAAKGVMKQYFIDLPDPDLAYFVQNTAEFDAYISDLLAAQDYAKINRSEMMSRILKDISYFLFNEERAEQDLIDLQVDCHHNYCQQEEHFNHSVWVTRKGAVSAKQGEWGIIPGSMGTHSFIVKGKGNPLSFHSCSHGAGRCMSRTKAKHAFTMDDLAKQTQDVECRKDKAVLDEIPEAYKNIHEVMHQQKDLVEIIYTLKQVLCIKG